MATSSRAAPQKVKMQEGLTACGPDFDRLLISIRRATSPSHAVTVARQHVQRLTARQAQLLRRRAQLYFPLLADQERDLSTIIEDMAASLYVSIKDEN